MPHRSESSSRASFATPSGWQARKSAATRQRIVEATLRCFVRLGYAHTTTPAIAEEAGLSRGAMLHHFPSRMDVVRAAITHLYARRLKAFRAAVSNLPSGGNLGHAALRAHWDQLQHPLYAVFLELYVAARTDPDLGAVLEPLEAAFVQEFKRTAREVVPEWRVSGRNFEIGYALVTSVLLGAALSMFRPGVNAPDDDLLHYIEPRVDELVRSDSGRAARPKRARTGTD